MSLSKGSVALTTQTEACHAHMGKMTDEQRICVSLHLGSALTVRAYLKPWRHAAVDNSNSLGNIQNSFLLLNHAPPQHPAPDPHDNLMRRQLGRSEQQKSEGQAPNKERNGARLSRQHRVSMGSVATAYYYHLKEASVGSNLQPGPGATPGNCTDILCPEHTRGGLSTRDPSHSPAQLSPFPLLGKKPVLTPAGDSISGAHAQTCRCAFVNPKRLPYLLTLSLST
ncbi:H(+)/Cl(-) exchange transporter 4 [Manis javanica]|nr:H(+)/Cl(-) exchange transporter 4 [Manis javanica]